MTYKPTGGKPGRPVPPVPDDPRVKPELPDFLWKAIEVEFKFYNGSSDPWPSSASVGQVARAAGCERRTIRERRKHPLYRAALKWYALDWLLTELSESDRQKAAQEDPHRYRPPAWRWSKRSRERWESMDAAERARWIARWVRSKPWPGPTQSPIDGKIYETQAAYIDHMIAVGAQPFEDLLAVL